MVDDVRNCKRYKWKYKEHDVYLLWGEDFVDTKFAFENRPENKELREFSQLFCEKLTEIKQEFLYNESEEE